MLNSKKIGSQDPKSQIPIALYKGPETKVAIQKCLGPLMKSIANTQTDDYELFFSPDLKALGLVSNLNEADTGVDEEHTGTFFCPFCNEHKVCESNKH